MKRILVIFSSILFAFISAKAQSNMVLNPSFENYYDTSLIGISSFYWGFVAGWSDPNGATSDLYVPNSDGEYVTPPSSVSGFEYPHTGYAYAGFIFLDLSGSNYYEYIQDSFRAPLISGQSYGIECYVSNADVMPNCVNDLGFYFSDSKLTISGGGRLLFTPQYANPVTNPIDTRVGWQRITGSYTAHGGEQFVSIGNFTPYPSCHFSCGDTSAVQEAYLFVDDVAVYDTAKTDTIGICMNDSVQIGGIWRHNAGLYTEMIGGLPVRFFVTQRPYSANLTIIARPFLPGDSVRISLLQKGGNDSTGFGNQNFLWASQDTNIDIPMYNIYGCDSTVRYRCGTHLGIGDAINNQPLWSVYPNPANDIIQVKLNINDPTKYAVTIIDVAGRELMTNSFANDKIDVTSLKSGMYYIKLVNTMTGVVIGTEKFVKE